MELRTDLIYINFVYIYFYVCYVRLLKFFTYNTTRKSTKNRRDT